MCKRTIFNPDFDDFPEATRTRNPAAVAYLEATLEQRITQLRDRLNAAEATADICRQRAEEAEARVARLAVFAVACVVAAFVVGLAMGGAAW